ncbi:esterase B1-like [Culicoides brevitarsis]|uniref:esterase B1-like n=1 Tax=Culicoides brevitarsis TaxID=469753 RepID=UPI00307C1512
MFCPIIETNYGPVRGLHLKTCYNKPYNAFYGIPYAEKPFGKFRFKSPRPLSKWEKVLDATKPRDSCWLFDKLNPTVKKVIGSDDCLHLNIYTPELETPRKLPVVIYFHGGRYQTMSGHPFYYGPDYLLEQNVIVVTFNFRMGAFGFLSLKDETLEVPGNAGMKDQVMALRWIKENISYFGGNSDCITIVGHSSGASSVHYHLLSEMSRNLFTRAIIMSGSAFVPWATIPDSDFAYRLAKALGYQGTSEDEKSILEFLKNANPEEIVMNQEAICTAEERKKGQLIAFGPVIEPYIKNGDTFIPKSPFLMTRNAWGNSVDVMIGGCSDEGLLLYVNFTPAILKSLGNFENIVALSANLDPNSQECIAKGLKIKKTYFGDVNAKPKDVDTYFQMLGHSTFWHGMWLTVQSRRKLKAGKTFLYRFDVEPTTNTTVRKAFHVPHMRKASHIEDTFYIFKAGYLAAHEKGSEEYKTMQVMTESFAAFARNGNPNGKRLKNVTWEAVAEEGDVKCFNIANGNELSFVTLPETPFMEVWDEICEHKF